MVFQMSCAGSVLGPGSRPDFSESQLVGCQDSAREQISVFPEMSNNAIKFEL